MVEVETEKKLNFHYEGSTFWLIFWMIVFFPMALILLFTRTSFLLNQNSYRFKYEGSLFWLFFWTVIFFPITFALLFLYGSFIMKVNCNLK